MIDKTKKYTSLSDEEIVRNILRGQHDLLSELYNRYADKIYHKCISIFKDKHKAKDVSHDIIIKIFTSLNKFKGISEFSYWVYAVTYNHCMSQVKNKKKTLEQFEELDNIKTDLISTEDIELENKVLRDMQLTELEAAMERLPANERIILLMRYQDKLSVTEIAIALKIGASAVKMRLKRSRDHLAKLLKEITSNDQ